MNETSHQNSPLPEVPAAKIAPARRGRISLVWVVPMLAALVGVWIGVNTLRNQGPTLTIEFRSADGLEANKTKIRCNGIDVGVLAAVELSADHQKVIATAKMSPKTGGFFVKDTQFWVVRPQISGANVSGLGTLISGAYLGMEIGQSKKSERHFVALDDAPVEAGGVHGRLFELKASELGSLAKGTPVYYRHLQAGQVVSYGLDPDGRLLTVKIFVQEPYDQLVTTDTRFWHASGLDVSLSASGVRVQTESLLSILVGGIAFENPPATPPAPPAAADSEFTLYEDHDEAYRLPPSNPQRFTLLFQESVRGLAVGAPVEFDGIPIGQVTAIGMQIDAQSYDVSVAVTIEVDPRGFGVQFLNEPAATGAAAEAAHRKIIDVLVSRGLRAELATGSLLTGARYIAMDFHADAPPVALDWSKDPLQFPTLPGQLQSLEDNLAGIVKKLNEMPLKDIGEGLNKTVGDLDKTLAGAQGTLTNANQLIQNAGMLIAPDSPLDAQLSAAIQQVGGGAEAIRMLADYLERHPESLVFGKSGTPKK